MITHLSIRPFVPQQDGGYFDEPLLMVWDKNNAVSAYTFPIPPLPSAFEWKNIPLERVVLEVVNRPGYALLDIPRESLQLPFRFA